jgi:hypothetical protein
MSLSPTQAQLLQGRVQELLKVIDAHQVILKEIVQAASEDTGRTEDKTRFVDAHAMLFRFEVQIQDLQNIAGDLQTTATLELLESDGA